MLGKQAETEALKEQLKEVDGGHRALADWGEKKGEFEKAAAKYSPVFEVGT